MDAMEPAVTTGSVPIILDDSAGLYQLLPPSTNIPEVFDIIIVSLLVDNVNIMMTMIFWTSDNYES